MRKINLIEYFENTVSSFPDKLALVDNTSQLSFGELKLKAQLIATKISETTEAINSPVAIYLPKTNDAIASFLGTLYSGNCYTPLDPKNPVPRIQAILNASKPSCIITNNAFLPNLEKCNLDIDIINLDKLNPGEDIDESYKYKNCIDTDPAYILHTSGSTGVPKGVVISHLSIIDYINWVAETFDITEKEKIGNQTPFIFDMSTLDIYLMIFKGATLYIIPEQKFIFPATLLDYINENKINFIFWVPAVLVNIANLRLLDTNKIPTVKKVLFGGEVMPPKHLGYWIKSLEKNIVYGNMYGPTEITGTCVYHIVDDSFDENESLPIGIPCRNTDVLVLNEKDELCKVGEKGELCVRGSSLALGYWNNFEKTNNVFVQNPLNKSVPERIYRTGDIVFLNEKGEYIYIGRKDFQIKLSGYRIDLGEIEHYILSVFDTINAGVFFDRAKEQIVLIYESEEEIPVKDFRLKLSEVLSKHMIPTRYVKMDVLPKSTTGKIDRALLNKQINNI
ncbi:amino acid adenylation domain-containing protein [Flagellimonas nanhaiensis]|uniref:Amino acid adenylation domain-containing protein n=1 Tax=Flagellimonas nanhaiensis TaxID=2292706 RepID=A0A371JKU5_9FLAO|nr:amino acid adenylation domain-containing protein [Allomuricauda nanhaiensis]RDY57585.1 amino acid adenylation domain-containing protein [Allomuricauda nanhaiensis]